MKSLAPACDWSSNLDGTFNVRRSMFDVGRSGFWSTNKNAQPFPG